MKSYKVSITETLHMTAGVKTSGTCNAEQLTEKRWKNSDMILNVDHVGDSCLPLNPQNGSAVLNANLFTNEFQKARTLEMYTTTKHRV